MSINFNLFKGILDHTLTFNILFTDIIETGANAVGMSIPPPATTDCGDREQSSRSQKKLGIIVRQDKSSINLMIFLICLNFLLHIFCACLDFVLPIFCYCLYFVTEPV